MTKLGKEKKSEAYNVASQVEVEDASVTLTEAMSRNENSNDPWLQTAAKRLKVQISNSDMWAADVFLSQNLITIDLFVYQPCLQKKNSWF